jgi:VIT1/CCC1 family predicted Fe2+/Mn2+ transporter
VTDTSFLQDEVNINKMALIIEASVRRVVVTQELKLRDVTRLRNFLANNASESVEGSGSVTRFIGETDVLPLESPQKVLFRC